MTIKKAIYERTGPPVLFSFAGDETGGIPERGRALPSLQAGVYTPAQIILIRLAGVAVMYAAALFTAWAAGLILSEPAFSALSGGRIKIPRRKKS